MMSTAQRNMLGILTILLSVIIQRVQPILQPQMPIQGGVGGGGMINGGFFNHHQQGFMQPGMQPGFMQPGMQPGGFLPPALSMMVCLDTRYLSMMNPQFEAMLMQFYHSPPPGLPRLSITMGPPQGGIGVINRMDTSTGDDDDSEDDSDYYKRKNFQLGGDQAGFDIGFRRGIELAPPVNNIPSDEYQDDDDDDGIERKMLLDDSPPDPKQPQTSNPHTFESLYKQQQLHQQQMQQQQQKRRFFITDLQQQPPPTMISSNGPGASPPPGAYNGAMNMRRLLSPYDPRLG
ncbi:uncharacterized protein [Atheta coriaria]|uniref:uncharacterized protein isoform X2 n=1 Tax=Dalotia coriaria TaxID=877792 RepID=UPI0031F41AD5